MSTLKCPRILLASLGGSTDLRDDCHGRSEARQVQLGDINAINHNPARIKVRQAEDGADERTLASTCVMKRLQSA